jgi:hypothetical protein
VRSGACTTPRLIVIASSRYPLLESGEETVITTKLRRAARFHVLRRRSTPVAAHVFNDLPSGTSRSQFHFLVVRNSEPKRMQHCSE